MTTLESVPIKARNTSRVADFVAFVADKETERVLKSFVLEQAMPHAYVAVGGIDDAVEYLAKVERSPLFLMVDLHGSSMPLSDLGRLSQVCEPSVQVVALGERNDVGLFRSLLKLGIRDYLVKPLTVELLMRTVNVNAGRISEVQGSRVGKMIGFSGTRGGVGTSTLALNLSRHLANNTHRRIAYVDLDFYGSAAASMLGVKSNNGLSDVLQNMHRLDPQYVERTLVPSGNRLFLLSSEMDYEEKKAFPAGSLKRVLELLCESFHYVIVDIGRAQDELVEEAYDHAARVYLITDRSVHSTRQAIRMLKHIEGRDNRPQTSIVLNSNAPVTAGKVETQDMTAAIGRPVLHEFHFEPKILSMAENLGEAPKGKGVSGFGQSIKRIANDLTGQRDEEQTGLLQKFRLRRG